MIHCCQPALGFPRLPRQAPHPPRGKLVTSLPFSLIDLSCQYLKPGFFGSGVFHVNQHLIRMLTVPQHMQECLVPSSCQALHPPTWEIGKALQNMSSARLSNGRMRATLPRPHHCREGHSSPSWAQGVWRWLVQMRKATLSLKVQQTGAPETLRQGNSAK